MSLPMKEFVARPTVTMTTEPETESEYATTTPLYSGLVGKSCKLARCYYLLYACLLYLRLVPVHSCGFCFVGWHKQACLADLK